MRIPWKTISLLVALGAIALLASAPAAYAIKFPYLGGDGLMPCVFGSGTKPQCTSWCNILVFLQNLTYFALTAILLILLPFKLIWGGIKIMTAGSSETRYKDGLKMVRSIITTAIITIMAWAVVGGVISLLSLNVTSNKVKVSWPDITCTVPVIDDGSQGG